MSGAGPDGPTDPTDPFRNPGWTSPADGASYPPGPPSAPTPGVPGAVPPPGAPPPPPGAPPGPRRARWPIAVAVVAGIGAVAFAIGVLGSGGDDPVATRDRDEDVRDRDRDDDDTTTSTSRPTSTTTPSTTSTTTTTPAPDLADLPAPGGPVVTAGAFTLQLPAGWRGADLTGGVEGVGAAMFPEDPRVAEAVQGQLELLPRSVQLMAFDAGAVGGTATFASNVSLLIDPTSPTGTAMDQLVAFQSRGMQAVAEVEDARVVQLGALDVGRIRSRFGSGPVTYGVLSYVVDTGSEVVILTYSFAEVDAAAERLADASASTFTAG